MHSNPCKTQTHTQTDQHVYPHTEGDTEKEREREREREAEQGTSDQPYELLPTAGHDARFGGGRGSNPKDPLSRSDSLQPGLMLPTT